MFQNGTVDRFDKLTDAEINTVWFLQICSLIVIIGTVMRCIVSLISLVNMHL